MIANPALCLLCDARYRVRDLFTDPADASNHLVDQAIRLGVWVDDRLSWVDWDEWNVEFELDPAGIGRARLQCSSLGLAIDAEDSLNGQTWNRVLTVQNLRPTERKIKLFQTQNLKINESDIGNTACYRPDFGSVVHYKGQHYFAFGLDEMTECATGIAGFAGLEGTWRDAEDGQLEANPIAQGSVDSTIAVELLLPASGTANARAFMVAGTNFESVRYPAAPIAFGREGSFEQRLESVLLTHARFSIFASLDSDIMETNRANYAYCWMRDGALVASLLARRGRLPEAARFFAWLNLVPGPPYLQKYDAAGHLGASWHPWIRRGRFQVPTQPDETALPLVAMADFVRAGGKLDGDSQLYAKLGRYLLDHRDPVTGLPSPGYDLWEERFGTHTYTVATVIAGLNAAAELAAASGDDAEAYRMGAESIKQAMLKHLVDPRTGGFARGLDEEGNLDSTPDASLLLLPILGVVEATDPQFERTVAGLNDKLWVHSAVGGMARYPGDYYFRKTEAYPGNPWVICTMWLAQVRCLQAKTVADLEEPKRLLAWAESRAERTGVLAEQYHPDTGEPLSVSPLTWSQAEVLALIEDLRQATARVAK